jgi:hypothetical protein
MRYGSTNSTVLFGVSSTAGHISAYDTSSFSTNRNLCFNADGGNVGIGTTDPVSSLHIATTNDFTISSDIDRTNVDERIGRIFFYNGTQLAGAAIESCVNVGGANNNTDLRFMTSYDYNNKVVERMRIDRAGNVGIGLTNPSKMLHAKGEVVVGTDADNFTNQKGSLYFIRGAGRATTGIGDRHHYISTRTDGSANGGSGNNMIFHVDDGTTTGGTSHATPLKLTGDGGVEIGGWKTKTWSGNMAGSGANTNINIINMVSSGTSGQRGEITGELTVMVNRGGGNQQRALYKVWLNQSKWGSTWYGSTVVLYSSQTGWTGITSVAMTGGSGTDNNIGVRIIGNTNTTGQYYIKFEGPLYVPT